MTPGRADDQRSARGAAGFNRKHRQVDALRQHDVVAQSLLLTGARSALRIAARAVQLVAHLLLRI
jgi:hypothetical protein